MGAPGELHSNSATRTDAKLTWCRWPGAEEFVGPIDFGRILAALGEVPTPSESAIAIELARHPTRDLAQKCRELAMATPNRLAPWLLVGAASRMSIPRFKVAVGRRSTATAIALGEIIGLMEVGEVPLLASLCAENIDTIQVTAATPAASIVLGHAICALLPTEPAASRTLLSAAPMPFVGWQVALREIRNTASELMGDSADLVEAEALLETALDRLATWTGRLSTDATTQDVDAERAWLVVLRARAARKAGRFRTAAGLLELLPVGASEHVRVAGLREQILVGARLIEASSIVFPVTPPDHVVMYTRLKPLEDLLHNLLALRPLDPVARVFHGLISMVSDRNLRAMESLTYAARSQPDEWEGTIPPSFSDLLTHLSLAHIRSLDPAGIRYGAEVLLDLLDWGCEVMPRALAEASTHLQRAGSDLLAPLQDAFVRSTGFPRQSLHLLPVLFDGGYVGDREPTFAETKELLTTRHEIADPVG